MKRKIMLLTIAAFLLTVIGCSNPSNIPTEETYIVWTDTSTYSEFQTFSGITLNDGYYLWLEINKSQWNEICSLVENEYRHYWTKAQIKDYLIGRGFDNSEATKRSAWFTTIDHGFIVTRERNVVYYILK